MQLLSVRLNISTADHPKTDGQSENLVRTLANMLCSFILEDAETLRPKRDKVLKKSLNARRKRTKHFTLNFAEHSCNPGPSPLPLYSHP